jgi:hypothetical protein
MHLIFQLALPELAPSLSNDERGTVNDETSAPLVIGHRSSFILSQWGCRGFIGPVPPPL